MKYYAYARVKFPVTDTHVYISPVMLLFLRKTGIHHLWLSNLTTSPIMSFLHHLLPPPKNTGHNLRLRSHNFTLHTPVTKQNYLHRMLFLDMYWVLLITLTLLSRLPGSTIQPLQRVMNAASRVIMNLSLRDHVKPALKQLHWLPVEDRIIYKLCLFMHYIHIHSV